MACATKIQWVTMLETYSQNSFLTPNCHKGF